MIPVYRFEYFHHQTGTYQMADDEYATAEAIREIGGRVIPGSDLLVDVARVSRAGYVSRAGLAGERRT